MTNLEHALQYREIGLSVIPLSPNSKIPPKGFSPLPYRDRLATEDEIKQWWSENPKYNIGIVTGKLSNLFVIDLDKDDKEYSDDIVSQYIPDSVICPTVNTPKGGQHLYFSYPEDLNVTIGTRILPGVDFRGEGGYVVAPPSINGNGKSYEWVVPYVKKSITPPPASFLTEASINNRINKNILYRVPCKESVRNEHTEPYNTYTILQEGTRDSDLFTVSNALIKCGCDQDFTRQVLNLLAKNANPPFSEKDAELKIKSALDRKIKRERNVQDEIKEYILAQKSLQETYVSLTATIQSLQLLTKEEKNAAYVAFNRLCKVEKLIEKYGDRRGEYRILDNSKEKSKMDLLSESEVQEFKVKLPLDLSTRCVISPGNIIVVSGSKSSGKTAMMMNIAWLNQNNFEVVYLNSEMHETEFKKRMKKFAPLSNWKITGYNCHNNYDDYIESKPNRVYIVDYLEVHENFYEIAKPIRKIHEKLGDAICIIGIQQKSGATIGRGGDFSAEKARLYLTMDYVPEEKRTKVTIYDAKEPRQPFDNVRGQWRYIKIIDGNKLSTFVDWQW